MQNEIDVLRDMSRKLEEIGVPFMLTGSLAMNYYATPRMTRDIDIVMELESNDVAKLVDCLEPEYYVPSSRARQAASSRTMFSPGVSVGTMIWVILSFRSVGPSGSSVRHITMRKSAARPLEVNHL